MQFPWNDKTYEIDYDFERGEKELPDCPASSDTFTIKSIIDEEGKELFHSFDNDELQELQESFDLFMTEYLC
jgi:hypothetical protein